MKYPVATHFAPLALALLLSACGGGSSGAGSTSSSASPTGSSGGTSAAQALATATPATSGSCGAGGSAVQVRIGLDANASGTLEAGEVSYTEIVCTPAAGGLVSVVPEPAGANCPTGGQRVLVGTDASGDGTLQPAEVSSSAFVCNGAVGVTGSTGAPGTPGTPGANGTNGTNGTNGADGADGTNSLLAVDAEPAGANCPAGGTRVRSGLDGNRNGALDDIEVGQTRYVCAGEAGSTGPAGPPGSPGTPGTPGATSLLLATAEPVGSANCANGGTRVQSGLDDDGNGTLAAGEVDQTAYICNPPPAGIAWVPAASNVDAAVNTGYITTGPNEVVVTLPPNPFVGSVVRVNGLGAGGWRVAQRAGHSIRTSGLAPEARRLGAWSERLGSTTYNTIAMSDNGRYVATAAYNGQIQVSSDFGETWAARESNRQWRGVAMSRDGRVMVATVSFGGIYRSRDYGVTWTKTSAPDAQFQFIAVSATGSRMVALVGFGVPYYSSNGGDTWTAASTGDLFWSALAMSADGRYVVAGVQYRNGEVGQTGQLHVSSDYGATWAIRDGVRSWRGAAMSADASRIWVGEFDGPLRLSTDYGETWTTRGPVGRWYGIASSVDGRSLAAVSIQNEVYTSDDYGGSWFARDNGTQRLWNAVACSRDCGRIAAVGTVGLLLSPQSTTTGTTGGLSGDAGASVELQHTGGGVWTILSHHGAITSR